VTTAYGEWLVAAIINWEERTVTTTLDLAQFGLERDEVYHVYDFWGGRYLGLVRETITLPRHQPHQTAVLLFKRPSPEPQFLTSTFHITQGAVEVASVEREARGRGQGLLVRLVKPGQQFGEILFALSEGYRAIGALVDGRRHRWRAVAPGVVALGFTLKDKGEVELWVEPA
jgi:hypothetical protein